MITRKKALYFLSGVCLFSGISILNACSLRPAYPPEVATPNKTAISPSDKYILQVSLQAGELTFKILDSQTQTIVFSPPNIFLSRFTTYFSWDKNDRVWIYSGDLGTYFWEFNQYTDEWEEYSASESGFPAPDFFKKRKSEYYSIPQEIATLENPAISPSEKYLLKIASSWENNAQWFHFQILNRDGKIIYSPTEKFYARRLNRFLWDENNRVWVSSYASKANSSKSVFYQESERSLEHSEIIYFWEQQNDGRWIKENFSKNSKIFNHYNNRIQEPEYLLNH